MAMCLPSKAPMQFPKFYFDSNVDAMFSHSAGALGNCKENNINSNCCKRIMPEIASLHTLMKIEQHNIGSNNLLEQTTNI